MGSTKSPRPTSFPKVNKPISVPTPLPLESPFQHFWHFQSMYHFDARQKEASLHIQFVNFCQFTKGNCQQYQLNLPMNMKYTIVVCKRECEKQILHLRVPKASPHMNNHTNHLVSCHSFSCSAFINLCHHFRLSDQFRTKSLGFIFAILNT